MNIKRISRGFRYKVPLIADLICFPFFFLMVGIVGSVYLLSARYRKRRLFRLSASPVMLCIQPGMVKAYKLHGDKILAYFKTSSLGAVQILDTVSPTEEEICPMPGVKIIGWAPGRWYDLTRRMGMREIPVVFYVFDTVIRLCHHISQYGFYCIRSIQHEHSALCGALASAALDVPHVVEVAGNYELLRRIWARTVYLQWFGGIVGLRLGALICNNFLLGWPLRRAYWVIGRNKNNYEHAFALGVPVERLSLIRIQLARSFSEEDRRLPPPLSNRYMLFVARITTEKFPLDVVAVYEKLACRYDDLSLVIIGDGVLLPEVRRMAETIGCSERIHILGAKPYDEVIRWTRGATIAFETYSGSALAEKLICSVPVVAYDVEWMSEIIIDNFSGTLVRFRDIEAAVEACATLLDDPSRANELARMGKQLALAMFDPATIMKKEERIFCDALIYARLRHRECG
jgi:glycosyltransferase involved in cell wall biosynthesis